MEDLKRPTFKEQYDKIVGAYLKNKLDPFNGCACFVGNLLNGNSNWEYSRDFATGKLRTDSTYIHGSCVLQISAMHIQKESGDLYTPFEILTLENTFIEALKVQRNSSKRTKYTEENLFNAMESTLLLLKKMHEKKGEIVENYTFEKRKLQKI